MFALMLRIFCPAIAISAMLLAYDAAAEDAVRGKGLYEVCAPCHLVGAASGELGPTLFGIVGRRAAARDDFRYSRALLGARIVWDENMLDVFLTEPQRLIPGTRMPFAGMPEKSDRIDLIAYLRRFH